MDGGKCILQVRGVHPFLSDKFDITKHKNYKLLSDANPKNAFDIERFVSTRLKVKPEDEYPVFNYVELDAEMPPEAYGVVTSDDEETEEFSDYQDLEPV